MARVAVAPVPVVAVAVGVPVPPVAPAVPVVRKRVHFVRGRRLPVDARRWAWGAPSTCSAPLPPPPARTVSALEGPIIRRRHPPGVQCCVYEVCGVKYVAR
eukprot:scaffold55030_cov68-Phaeocystis_antarctica.AAC.3